MTNQAESQTKTTKTVSLLDVASEHEIRERPLRSLIILANRVLDDDILAEILEICGENVYCRLVTLLAAPEEDVDEDRFRELANDFADALGDAGTFFNLLNDGQVQLTQQIGNLVAKYESSVDPSLAYAPCGLSFAPAASGVTFHGSVGDPDRCRNCGLDEDEHVWRCSECQRELPSSGRCDCGSCNMPESLCPEHPSARATLHCRNEFYDACGNHTEAGNEAAHEMIEDELESLEKSREYYVAIGYIHDTVGKVSTDGWSEDDLQAVITEVHCTCMNVEPKFDPDDDRYEGARPWLLGEAIRLLQQATAFVTVEPMLDSEIQALLKRADPLVNRKEPSP